MYRLPLIGLLLAALLSCAQPTEEVPAPMGTYTCQATERGRLVGTGWFAIESGGQVTDKVTGATGSWTYDGRVQEFQFAGNLDVDRAAYDGSTGQLIFYLHPGVYRTHVEDGKLVCYQTGE